MAAATAVTTAARTRLSTSGGSGRVSSARSGRCSVIVTISSNISTRLQWTRRSEHARGAAGTAGGRVEPGRRHSRRPRTRLVGLTRRIASTTWSLHASRSTGHGCSASWESNWCLWLQRWVRALEHDRSAAEHGDVLHERSLSPHPVLLGLRPYPLPLATSGHQRRGRSTRGSSQSSRRNGRVERESTFRSRRPDPFPPKVSDPSRWTRGRSSPGLLLGR
jgi:hypothetical protein